jgi:class 3 adenylate cyclase
MTRHCSSCGTEASPGARFCAACGAPLAAQPLQAVGPGAPALEDELRPVTALFADVVGSTSLGERLSPDEVKALIGECVSRMARAVEEYGGTVQAYMGDGICAYFGVPVAHEDDQERAARAALRILEVVGEYSRDVAAAWGISDFDVRAGLNSGQTAVGMVGAGDPQAVALGDTTNVAARLQSAAEPGTIAVGEATARQLAHRFALEAVGDVTVKGKSGPLTVWRLMRPVQEDGEPATPLVGRATELGRVRGVLDELISGRGQILFLVGDMGIGKSRLLAELSELAGDRVTWLEGHCLSYGGLLTWPFVEIVRNWLELREGEPEIAVRTKARAKLGLALGAELSDALPGFGRLLRVRLDPERSDPQALGGDEVARAYTTWIEALARERPVVLALEDVHWADPQTRELAEAVLAVTDREPVLVVCTFRSDAATEGWKLRTKVLAEYSHRATELQLPPLDDAAARELLQLLLPAGLDDRSAEEIVARAEGNPLYLEELLRILVEGGSLETHRRFTVSMVSASALSPALQALLVARIDLLPPAPRRLAQIAAVIGRTFPERVLERVAGQSDVNDDLTALLRAEVIREVRRYPEEEYTFKHGLFQQAALSTLTPPRRQELHGRVAAAFEELYAGSLDGHLDRIAHHYAQSGNLARALECLETAGDNAAALNASTEAATHWERARSLADRIGDRAASERLSRRIDEIGHSRSEMTAPHAGS